jgi:hypothetical protein
MGLPVPVPRLLLLHLHTLHPPVALISIDYSLSARCSCPVLYDQPLQFDRIHPYTAYISNITNCAAEPRPFIPSHLPDISDRAPCRQPLPTRSPPIFHTPYPESTRSIWAFAPTA